MSDLLVHRLEIDIREDTAMLTDVPHENAQVRARLMAALERIRLQISRQDAVRLEVLIEKRTRCRNGGGA